MCRHTFSYAQERFPSSCSSMPEHYALHGLSAAGVGGICPIEVPSSVGVHAPPKNLSQEHLI